MAGDRGALQFDLFGEQNGLGTVAITAPPMLSVGKWQLPETSVFVDALKRGALSDSIAVIRRMKVETAWKVLLEAGFTVTTGKTHSELLAPLQKDLMEAVQRRLSGHELRIAKEKEQSQVANSLAGASDKSDGLREVASAGNDTRARRKAALAVLGDDWKSVPDGKNDAYKRSVKLADGGRYDVLIRPARTVAGDFYVGSYFHGGKRSGPGNAVDHPKTLAEAKTVAESWIAALSPALAQDPEVQLRALWSERGVPTERQDALIKQIAEKAQPGTIVGPFVVRDNGHDLKERVPVGEEKAGASAITPVMAGNLKRGDLVSTPDGTQFYAWSARHDYLEVFPVEQGKPVIFAGNSIKFHLNADTREAFPERRHETLTLVETPFQAPDTDIAATAGEVARIAGQIARREHERSVDPRVDRILAREGYLQEFARDKPALALPVANEWRENADRYSEISGSPPDWIRGYASIVESQLELRQQPSLGIEKQEPGANTADAGAELTYNRRNRVKRGLVWEDLEGLETALRVREVTKAKVYPRPDYQALIDSGVEPVHAHLVKQVYDSLAAKPSASNPTDAQLQAYITGVNRVMVGALNWVRDPNGAKVWNEVRGNGSRMLDQVYPNGWKEHQSETSILGNRYFSALQPGRTESRRAKQAVADGWPNSQEAWQKQGFAVAYIDEVQSSIYAGTDRHGTPYVSVRLLDRTGRIVLDDLRVEGAENSDDPAVVVKVAARSAELVNRFALINKRRHLVSGHDSEEAAMEAARASVRRGGEAGISDSGISVESAQRIGVARRVDGEDVSSEQVLATFGFRGINFGNWMKGKSNEAERQLHLNHIYDAFLDLAEILDLPPRAMSLDGMLGIAVGAQGGGRFLAHFVPGVNEINLTRTCGAGALAHEWAHAVDHYFGRLAGLDRSDTPFLSAHATLPATIDRMVLENGKWQRAKMDRFGEGLRPEIRAHFASVVKAMTKRRISDEEVVAQKAAALERTKGNVSSWLKAIRRDFDSDRIRSVMVNRKGESVSVLDAFDDLAKRVLALDLGGALIGVSRNKAVWPVVGEIRDLYKVATGRLYSLENTMGLQGNVDSLRYQLSAEAGEHSHAPQMVSTAFAKAAAQLDADKPKPYWSTTLEMFARSFDVFVSEALEKRTAMNSYLSHAGRADETTPLGDDRRVVMEAFGNLVGEIRTRETEKGGVALFSFGGTQAQVGNERALARAKQLLASGSDAEVVRRDTGWFKGADAKWRFEIDDSGAKLKKPFPHNGAAFGDVFYSVFKNRLRNGMLGLRLGDILDHPSLFAAYPQLANLSVSTQPGTGASYLRGSPVSPPSIEVGEEVPMHEVISCFLHEIQHGIQTIEGFATGGSPRMASLPTNEAFAQQINAKFHRRQDEIKQSGEYRAFLESQIAAFSGETRFVPGRSGRLRDLAAEAAANAAWEHFIQPIETERREQIDRFLKLSPSLQDKYGVYAHLAGEVESRNVQARMKLSVDERRTISPEATADVGQTDVIVLFNGREMLSAPLPANAVGQVEKGLRAEKHSVETLCEAIDKAFLDQPSLSSLLLATGRFSVIEADDLPAFGMNAAGIAEQVSDQLLAEVNGERRVMGFVRDGRTHLVADHIDRSSDVRGLVLHELGVHALHLGRSDKEFREILTEFEKLRDAGDSRVVAAFQCVPADTHAHLVSEEALGYFVEANPRLPLAARVLSWFKEMVVKMGDCLPAIEQSRLGKWARSLSPNDLVHMASAATRDAAMGLQGSSKERETTKGALGLSPAGANNVCRGQGRGR